MNLTWMIGGMSTQTEDQGVVAHQLYQRLKDAQRRFGAVRLEIGTILQAFKDNKLWEGMGDTFGQFLEQEKVNSNFAYQTMLIARKFLFELKVTPREFEKLAMVNMRTLYKAAKVITPDNRDDVIDIVTLLHERDALDSLAEMEGRMPTPERTDARVNKIVRELRSLPDDLQIDVLNILRLDGTVKFGKGKNGGQPQKGAQTQP